MPFVSKACHTGHRVGSPSALPEWKQKGWVDVGGCLIHALLVRKHVHMPSKGRRRGGGYNKSCCGGKQGSVDGVKPLFAKVGLIQSGSWELGGQKVGLLQPSPKSNQSLLSNSKKGTLATNFWLCGHFWLLASLFWPKIQTKKNLFPPYLPLFQHLYPSSPSPYLFLSRNSSTIPQHTDPLPSAPFTYAKVGYH